MHFHTQGVLMYWYHLHAARPLPHLPGTKSSINVLSKPLWHLTWPKFFSLLDMMPSLNSFFLLYQNLYNVSIFYILDLMQSENCPVSFKFKAMQYFSLEIVEWCMTHIYIATGKMHVLKAFTLIGPLSQRL